MNGLLAEPETPKNERLDGNPAEGSSSASSASIRILYVDDEPTLRRFGELVLIRSGYEVDTAANGEEAWEALKVRKYDLMITDNHMPKLTGLELIGKMGAAGLRLPIILASSIVNSLSRGDPPLFERGAMLAKPFTPTQLVTVVKELLREVQPV